MKKVMGLSAPVWIAVGLTAVVGSTLLVMSWVCPSGGGCFSGHPCQGVSQGDGKVWWSGLEHNTFDPKYRTPFGAVPSDQDIVRIRFQSCANDVGRVALIARSSRDGVVRKYVMQPASPGDQPKDSRLMVWEAKLPVTLGTDVIHYFFEVRDGQKPIFYLDDDFRRAAGGVGRPVEEWTDRNHFQLTVYDRNMKVPSWSIGAVVYQVFLDRFRNGDPSNDPQDGKGFVYGQPIVRKKWTEPICKRVLNDCWKTKYNTFYGGDLRGVTEKLPFLQKLGVNVLYLSPVFESPSNHRYDTMNYLRIDPRLGRLEDFEQLVDEAKKLGIHVIVDGVFNHVSSDSPYFDMYGRWNSRMQLVSPEGKGVNDGSGACESEKSRWRSWFFIPDAGSPAGSFELGKRSVCPNQDLRGSKGAPQTYDAWFQYFTLPRLNTRHHEVRDLFYQKGKESVGPYWTLKGLGGWRLDAPNQVDMGQIAEPKNGFWRGFSRAVKSANPEAWLVGESWENATPFLLGGDWDSVTNYRLRSALLDWMFDECEGLGCGGDHFTDNDSNFRSPIGSIAPINETQFLNYIRGIQEAYPDPVFKSALNLIGSHDTNRIQFLLKKISRNEDPQVARQKLKFVMGFLMTYPGAPMIYYGDEAGVAEPGQWENNTWQDDPYNRVAYPWEDQGLTSDRELVNYFESLGQLRSSEAVLRAGDFSSVFVDDDKRVLVFKRELQDERMLVVLNRSERSRTIRFQVKERSVSEWEEVFPRRGIAYSQNSGWVKVSDVEGLSLRVLKAKLKSQ